MLPNRELHAIEPQRPRVTMKQSDLDTMMCKRFATSSLLFSLRLCRLQARLRATRTCLRFRLATSFRRCALRNLGCRLCSWSLGRAGPCRHEPPPASAFWGVPHTRNVANARAVLRPQVAKRRRAWQEKNPSAKIISLGIGTLLRIPPSVAHLRIITHSLAPSPSSALDSFVSECTRLSAHRRHHRADPPGHRRCHGKG